MSDTVVERHRIAGPAAHLPAERAVAGYDSASSMLRALGLYLHDCDTPMLGIAPASAEPFVDPLLKALDHLPRGAREALFTWGGIGDASGEHWGEALKQARKSSGFVGVDPGYYPVDLSTAAGFHHDLVQLPGSRPPPAPLTVEELDNFSATWSGVDKDGGITYRHADAGGVT